MSKGWIWSVGLGILGGALVVALVMDGTSPETLGASQTITTGLPGEQLFQVACASCHGTTGYGRVFTMDKQTIKTPNIRYAALAKMYTKNFDQQARTAITKGLDETGQPLNPMMPRWTFLSPADVNKIIAYLKTLK